MKKIILMIFAVLLFAVTACGDSITVKRGTEVLVRSAEKLKSNQVKPEQVIRFTVERPVTDENGFILIERGASAYGKILKASSAGAIGAKGSLSFSVDSVEAFNGKIIPLSGSQDMNGKSVKGTVIVGSIFLTPLALLFRGSNAVIDPKTLYKVYVADDTVLIEEEDNNEDEEQVDMLEIYRQRKNREKKNTLRMNNGGYFHGGTH
ncbi:MAG: hypothetical protein IJ697_08045 [Synergistaceae bacterium]|nr:hypothetical protein [Synergistaceae bacterium]